MATSGKPSPLPQRKRDIPWRLLAEDRGMLLDLDSGNYYELSGAGPYVWACLDGKSHLDEIARMTAAAYGTDDAQVLQDLEGFVDALRAAGLLAQASDLTAEDFADPRDAVRTMPYAPPTFAEKGNLKYLGQLD